MADRPPELTSLLREAERGIEAGLGQTHRQSRDRHPARLQRFEELPQATPFLTQQVGLGDTAVGEGQFPGVAGVPAELSVGGSRPVPVSAPLDQQGADPLVAALLGGDRGDGHPSADLGPRVGDEAFRAVDHPLLSLVARPGLGPAGVRTSLGLGQSEGPELASGTEFGEVPLLLLAGPELEDRRDPQGDRSLKGYRQRRVRSGYLL